MTSLEFMILILSRITLHLDSAHYATVDRRGRDLKKDISSSNPCITQEFDDHIYTEETPPVPNRGYTRYYILVLYIRISFLDNDILAQPL